MPSVDAQTAADIAIAVQHGDRDALIAALRNHPDAKDLEEDVLQETANILLEDA